jgi:acyl-coenzyme A thioesterase PaaI-like protein
MDPEALRSEGWTQFETGGFSAMLGPFWFRGSGAEADVGFVAQPKHCNNHIGTVHGGVLMTFADIALGYAVVQALGAPRCATAQLQTHFVAVARIGAFISCRPEIIRQTSQLIFLRGLISAGDKIVASADGIWKVLELRAG